MHLHASKLLLFLALQWVGLTAFGQIQLGMDLREFVRHYPELTPTTVGFTGQLARDSTWHGLDWHMSFAFGDGSMTGAFIESEPVGSDPSVLKPAYNAVVTEFNEYYGQPTHWLDSIWPAAHLPDDSLKDFIGYREQWMLGRMSVLVELQARWQLPVDSLEFSYRYILRVEMSSTTKQVPGLHSPISPMSIGMRVEQFGAFHPHFVNKGISYRGLRTRDEKLGNIDGEWSYWFENGTLHNYKWSRFFKEMPQDDPEAFEETRLTALALIGQLEKAAGPPALKATATDSLVQDGFEIVEKAVWEMEKETVTVFLGVHDGTKGLGSLMEWRIDPAKPE